MLSELERRALVVIFAAGLVLAAWSDARWGDPAIDPVVVDQVAELGGHLVDGVATPFTLSDMDGQPFSLHDFRGDVVFLNFWASWCPPCREEMPSMRVLASRFGDRPFRMVTVTQDDDTEALTEFLADTHFAGDDVLVLRDHGGTVTQSWGTRLLPETYVIDPEGHVIARFMGARDWTSEPSLRMFEQLLRAR